MLLAAGERVAKQLPAAMRADDMEWEDVGKAEEEDAFLVEWKAEVRRMSNEMHNHPSECVQSLSGVTASRRCALCCSPCATTWRNAAASFRLFPDLVNVATSTTTVWLVASPFYYELPFMLISNTFLLALCDLYAHINHPSYP